MRDTPPVIPYETPPRPAPKRRDPMSGWYVADAILFMAWLLAYQEFIPMRMTRPPASRGETMLVWLLFLAASGLFAVLMACWLVRRFRRKGPAG